MDVARDPADLTGMEVSAIALNRTVDALSGDQMRAPSLLPGWTRAHVVAHLALNGRALAHVLDAVGRGEPAAMYESDEQRDAEIEEYAERDPAELRDGLLAATTAFSDAVTAMDPDRWTGFFDRLPGGPTWPAASIVATRRREVEIHHVDLGAAYTQHDWPRTSSSSCSTSSQWTRQEPDRCGCGRPTWAGTGRWAAKEARPSAAAPPTSAGG
jgi:maleylpyruvate isomerase